MFFTQSKLSTTASSIPATDRPLPSRKASRLRFAWFVLGSVFGSALTYYVYSTLHTESEVSKQLSAFKSFAFLESSLAPLPVAPASLVTAAATPAVHAPAKAEMVLPADLNMGVRHGDTITSMLMHKGVSQDEAYNIVESMRKVYNPRQLNIGQALELHLDKSKNDPARPVVTGLTITVSPLRSIELSRNSDDTFTAHEIKAPVFKDVARGGGTINSSLYQTGIDSGVPPQLLGELIKAFSYDVDFQRDIKEGDELDVVYERMHTAQNVTAGHGNVLYASLVLNGREITLYNHVSPDGYSGYYNNKGESVRKALLRTPIDGAHITSGFGMRMHPLLGYSRMHKGIDFGAVTGTPIYAAGDGVIDFAGRKTGYGNYVKLKHNATYSTAYAHASRFASGIRPGVHVKQGQVIAYVGATGAATGPHLHYEILINNAQVNPAGVKFRTGQTLVGRELTAFKRELATIKTALNTLPRSTQVAMLAK